jgi:GDP/UDP-N,N'-diacetylbacillosamine 2-epimerase (hydrolysing)
MKVLVLTSSRADYSIYYPLLRLLNEDPYFDLSIVAFGTHLSKEYGYTIDQIFFDGFTVHEKIETLPHCDSPESISQAIGLTVIKFSEFWSKCSYDFVFCLGDRYEMFAACLATVPFNIKLAHIHGGEKTLGAIDDCFRHSITHMATVHFTSAEPYRRRVVNLKENDDFVYNVGALSIDNLKKLKLLTINEFFDMFKIDLSIESILITFHPETVSFEKNILYVETLIEVLTDLKNYQFIITMPNSDTMGNVIRKKLNSFINDTPHAFGIESFGTVGYLSCMKYCSFMMGNTSSGFIEASFFNKPVINLGSRQNGRIITPNIINSDITRESLINAIQGISKIDRTEEIKIYGDGNTAEHILTILKNLNERFS